MNGDNRDEDFDVVFKRAVEKARAIRAAKEGTKGVRDTQAALVSILERLVDGKRDRTWEPG
jgi:hypothetical protein